MAGHGEELAQLSLIEVGTRISDGEISPVEVTRNALDRLEMFGSALGADFDSC